MSWFGKIVESLLVPAATHIGNWIEYWLKKKLPVRIDQTSEPVGQIEANLDELRKVEESTGVLQLPSPNDTTFVSYFDFKKQVDVR